MELQKAMANCIRRMEQSNRSAQSVRSYESTFNVFRAQGYTEVTDKTVFQFLSNYANAATKNKMLAHFRTLSKWYSEDCASIGRVTLDKFPEVKELPEVIAPERMSRLLTYLKENKPSAWAIATIMANTGMRIGELLPLDNRQFTTHDGVPGVKFRGKGDRFRFVPFNDEARAAWDELRRIGNKPSYRVMWWWLNKAAKEAGIENIKSHHFRHTVATTLHAQGESYDDIADLFGNSVEVVRGNYSRLDASRLSKLTDKL